jgi:phosphopantothenoylcysteine synthetase/decarboxylase
MNMSNRVDSPTGPIFVFVCGAGSCRHAPELIRSLVSTGAEVYSVLTPNVELVTDPAALMDIDGNHWIADYGQPPLDRFPFGTMLVAPCTFNTLNKLSAGIADNLATAMLGDALGTGCQIVIAPGMNRGQWANPRVSQSVQTLTDWGCEFVPPREIDGRLTLAPIDAIVGALSSQPRDDRS